MKCKNHKEEEAKFICDKCKMPVCEACSRDVRGNKVCTSCIDRAVYAQQDRAERVGFWNKLIFLVLACMPGAAHMQMGLFKRGMQLMLTFIGGIVFISYANVESFLPLAIVPTWFFSFFDAYNIRRKQLSGVTVEDTEAYDYQFLINNKKILGAALVVFGFIGFLNAIDRGFYNSVVIFGLQINEFYWMIKRTIIPVLLIASGAALLLRLKKAEKQIAKDVMD